MGPARLCLLTANLARPGSIVQIYLDPANQKRLKFISVAMLQD